MSKADELKAKNENLFERNTILLNENERLKNENADLRDNYDQFKAIAEPEIERLREHNSYMFDTIALKSQQIEKLEKENVVLKGRTEEFEKQILGLLYKYESVYKRFPDLKDAMNEAERVLKENAELKHNKKTVAHLADCLEEKMKERIEELETRCTELFLQNNEFAERFEKSIEIIKKLLSCCRNYPQENADKMKQAEQFLQENEDDLEEGCPDVLCEDCTKEDCTVRKLGLVPNKEIEK